MAAHLQDTSVRSGEQDGHAGDGPRTGGDSGEPLDEEKGTGEGEKWRGQMCADKREARGVRGELIPAATGVESSAVGRATVGVVAGEQEEEKRSFRGRWARQRRGKVALPRAGFNQFSNYPLTSALSSQQ